jgi:hypothetical protein
LSPFRERPIGPGGTTGEIQRDFYPTHHFFSGIND